MFFTVCGFMACVADVCRASLGGPVAEVGVSEMKTEQLREDLTMKENRDHRSGVELKLEEEIPKDSVDKDRQKQEEEKESKLVAGISLDHEKGSEGRRKEEEDIKNAKHEASSERERGDHAAINRLTPPRNTTPLWETSEIPLIQIITETPNPPVSAPELPASPAPPGEERSFLPTPAEAPQQPGHGLRGSQGLHSEDVGSVLQTEKVQTDKVLSKTQTEAPKVSHVESVSQHLNAEGYGNKRVEQAELWKTKAKTSPLKERASTEKQKAASLSERQRGKKQNRGSKSTKAAELKEKRKVDNRTPKAPKREENLPPTHFPYFLDDYCPPECACYGR